jgi:hypothetical protein
MPPSRDELDRFTRASVDPMPWGRIARPNENGHLTDEQLCQEISGCNGRREPTSLLRLEYKRRLRPWWRFW